MKRSSAVNLVLVTAAAAAMTACREKPTRYCVDANNRTVDDWDCQDNANRPVGAYHWYYGGAHGLVGRGTRLSGGSVSEPAGGFSTPSAGTARGVFGGAGEHAAGGEGGGHGGGGGE